MIRMFTSGNMHCVFVRRRFRGWILFNGLRGSTPTKVVPTVRDPDYYGNTITSSILIWPDRTWRSYPMYQSNSQPLTLGGAVNCLLTNHTHNYVGMDMFDRLFPLFRAGDLPPVFIDDIKA